MWNRKTARRVYGKRSIGEIFKMGGRPTLRAFVKRFYTRRPWHKSKPNLFKIFAENRWLVIKTIIILYYCHLTSTKTSREFCFVHRHVDDHILHVRTVSYVLSVLNLNVLVQLVLSHHSRFTAVDQPDHYQ